MATNEQIERILSRLERAQPEGCFQLVNEAQAGIRAVLRLLCESDGAVTAGRISERLRISTARVAVLLKKMVAKGLIAKERDASDGRKTVVHLTEAGKETAARMRRELYDLMGRIVDAVGEARLSEFMAIAEDIHDVIKQPCLDL